MANYNSKNILLVGIKPHLYWHSVFFYVQINQSIAYSRGMITVISESSQAITAQDLYNIMNSGGRLVAHGLVSIIGQDNYHMLYFDKSGSHYKLNYDKPGDSSYGQVVVDNSINVINDAVHQIC